MPHVRKTLGVTRVNPKLLTAAERLQMALAKEGVTIEEVERRTGHSRSLLRQELRGQRNDVFRSRESSLENYLEWLDAQWAAGKRNATELWRYRAFVVRRVVSKWAAVIKH